MHKNSSTESNIAAAKMAARQMLAEWFHWKSANNPSAKKEAVNKYVAAATSCKVYVEHFLKQLYPNEKVSKKIQIDIQQIVKDIDQIDKVNEMQLQKLLKDIDQLNRDAA